MRAFREESGNAGITGREMPSAEVLASMQQVEDRAGVLRDAGVPGTWEELKVRATLDLLQERDSRPAPASRPRAMAPRKLTSPARPAIPAATALAPVRAPAAAAPASAR